MKIRFIEMISLSNGTHKEITADEQILIYFCLFM